MVDFNFSFRSHVLQVITVDSSRVIFFFALATCHAWYAANDWTPSISAGVVVFVNDLGSSEGWITFSLNKAVHTALHPVFSVAKITPLVLYSLLTKTLSNCSTKDKHNIRSSLLNSLPVCAEFRYTYFLSTCIKCTVHMRQMVISLIMLPSSIFFHVRIVIFFYFYLVPFSYLFS